MNGQNELDENNDILWAGHSLKYAHLTSGLGIVFRCCNKLKLVWPLFNPVSCSSIVSLLTSSSVYAVMLITKLLDAI